MSIKIRIIICFLLSTWSNSFAQVTTTTKEYYSWGIWGSGSENVNRVLKKKNHIHSLAIYNYADSVFPNDFILKFHKLKHLFIGGNPKEKHYLYIDSIKLANLTGLVEVQISNFIINKFPSALTMLDSLKILHIDYSNLNEVTNDIGKFKNLRSLGFAGNRLVDIPDSIRALTKLRFIDLTNNNFVAFPKALIDLPHINEIELNNPFDSVKEGFNQNEIDYKKGYDCLFQLATKRSVGYINIEVRDCDEYKFITQSFKRDIEVRGMYNPLIKSPLKKLYRTTKSRKLCLEFPYIF